MRSCPRLQAWRKHRHPGPRAEWALSLAITNTGLVCRFVCLSPQAVSVLLLLPPGSASGRHPWEPWLGDFWSFAHLLLGQKAGRRSLSFLRRLIWEDKTHPRSQNGTLATKARVPSWGIGTNSQAGLACTLRRATHYVTALLKAFKGQLDWPEGGDGVAWWLTSNRDPRALLSPASG